MYAPGDDGFAAGLRACTAELARIIDGDLGRPVPTCPGWTFRQLATHLGRGHRWAAQIVATRATAPVPMREVADGKLPEDPARHASWLTAGADQVIEAVAAAGGDRVWTMTGIRPASFWTRRRAHEAAVHLADAQLAAGRDADLDPGLAANGVDEWLGLIAAGTARPARELRGDGQSLHLHATDPGLPGTGEWLITRTRPASPSSTATAKPTSPSADPRPTCSLSSHAACRPRLPASKSSASRPCSPTGSSTPHSDRSTSQAIRALAAAIEDVHAKRGDA